MCLNGEKSLRVKQGGSNEANFFFRGLIIYVIYLDPKISAVPSRGVFAVDPTLLVELLCRLILRKIGIFPKNEFSTNDHLEKLPYSTWD